MISGWRLLALGVATGGALRVIYILVRRVPNDERRAKWWEEVLGWIGAGAYGWALLAALNGLLTQGAPSVFAQPVLAKRIGSGKNFSYNLTLPAFGPVEKSEEWQVAASVYRNIKVGDRACIFIHPGALEEPWYEAYTCASLERAP